MPDLLVHWLVPVMLALAPAAWRVLRGRSLARHLDSPALAERLQSGRNALTFVFALALTLLLVEFGAQAWWAVPLLLLSSLAAGWPLRRALFGETWSIGSYLWFYVRLVVAIFGFWLLLMATPALAWASARPWIAGAALGVVLLAWNAQWGTLLRFVMRTTPVQSPELVERFRAILSKTALNEPRVEFVDMRGGVLVNALAVPDTVRPSVLFTSSLLERLDADEVAAVFAHEVAHLEHFNPHYLKRWRWAGWGLILAGAGLASATAALDRNAWLALWCWPFVVIIYLAVLSQRRQKHETESDIRAAELTGDREALVRGLVKLHALMKMPRRLDPDVEAHASHPSLARRIQALREAGGVAPSALLEPVCLQSPAASVTLHPDRLIWTEGAITSYTFGYSQLEDLRVVVDARGAARLVVSDPNGRRWSMPLAAEDVARAQAALDVVDTRLRPELTPRGLPAPVGPLVAALASVLALGASQLAAAVVALVAIFAFHKPLVRAAGVAGLAGGFLALRDGGAREFAVMLILASALLLFLAWRDRRDAVASNTWALVSLLGALAVLSAVPIVIRAADVLELHRSARAWPVATVLALAFTAAALPKVTLAWRISTVFAVVAAGIFALAGSTQALDALLVDPFLQPSPYLEAKTLAGRPATFTLELVPEEVVLSPSGVAVAAIVHPDHDSAVHAGRLGAPLRRYDGHAALFVDDRRVLVADRRRGASTVRLVDVDTGVEAWAAHLDLVNVTLSVDRNGQTWHALGIGAENQTARVSGDLAGAATERREWNVPVDEESTDIPIWSSGSTLLVQSTEFVMPGLAAARLGPWAYWLNPWRSESRLVLFNDRGSRELVHSKLEVTCLPGSFAGEPPVCEAFDGSRTHMAMLDVASGTLTPLARIGRRVIAEYARGWLTGWNGRRPFALDPSTGALFELEGDSRFAVADRVLAVVTSGDTSTTLRIYAAPSVK
jgi:Zn-dependent protease with chaperone function